MNPIDIKKQIDFYNNLTENARFMFTEYDMAVNSAIIQFLDEKLGDRTQRNPENFQWVQSIRSDIYTLLATATPTLTVGTVINNRYYSITPTTFPAPADYYDFVCLTTLIDGYTDYSRPTSFNERGPLFKDSFRHPTNQKTFFNDTSSGFVVYRGTGGTFTSVLLEYIKQPATFTIGPEGSLVTGTLTNAVQYYATEISTYNGVTYQIGAILTGTGAALTSGQAMPVLSTVACALPPKVHDEICKMASVILLKSIGQYNEAAITDSNRSKI